MSSQQLLFFGMRRPPSFWMSTTTATTASRQIRRIPNFTRQGGAQGLLLEASKFHQYPTTRILGIRSYSRNAYWVPQAYRKFDEQQQNHQQQHFGNRKDSRSASHLHKKRRPGGFHPKSRSGSPSYTGVGSAAKRSHSRGHKGIDSSRSRHYNRSKQRTGTNQNTFGGRDSNGVATATSSNMFESSFQNDSSSSFQEQQETNNHRGGSVGGRYSFKHRSSSSYYDENEPSQRFFRERKIEIMQQNLNQLLQQYQKTVFEENTTHAPPHDQFYNNDNGGEKNDINNKNNVSNESIMIRHLLQSLHDRHNQFIEGNNIDTATKVKDTSNNGTISLKHLHASEQSFAEICRLMQRLIGTWAKQQAIQLEGLQDDFEDDNNKVGTEDNNDSATSTTASVTVDIEVDERILPYNVAEDLLMAFVQLRSDRTRLVKEAHERELKHKQALTDSSTKNSWSGWLKHVFVINDGRKHGESSHENDVYEDDGSINGQPSSTTTTATHLDPSYAPNVRLFRDVMKTVYDQTPVGIISKVEGEATKEHNDDIYRWRARLGGLRNSRNTQEIRRAHRLSKLLDVMSQNDIVPDTHVLEIVLQAHGDVGNFEFAKKAERIYYKYGLRQGISLFHALLRAYRLASFFEKNESAKVQAAKQAEWLLQKRESVLMKRNVAGADAKNSNSNSSSASGGSTGGGGGESRRMHQLSHISYNLVLQTLSNPGIKALPDMCARAESLMELWMGKEAFRKLVNANDDDDMHASVLLPTTSEVPDLNVFHHLIFLYVSSGRPDKMERAKRLLRYMQQNSDRCNYPNVFTYNGILRGLLHQNRKLMRIHDADNGRIDNSCKRDAAVNSSYAHELLDSMSDYPWSRPNRETFTLLLNMWKSSKSSQGGNRAEELLSRMEMYSGIAGDDWDIQRDSYQSTIQCWCEAAAAGQAGAAERAYRILLSMETQSGSGFLNFPKDPIGGPNMKLWSQVDEETLTARNDDSLEPYKDSLRPVAFDYNSVIETCSKTRLPSDRDIALEIAFDAYNRMIARGVRPTSKSYAALLYCCIHLLPDAPDRRLELARTVFQAASSENKVNDSILKAFRLAKDGGRDDTSSSSSLKTLDNAAEAEL